MNITIEILNDNVVICQLPPSGRKSNASVIDVPLAEWSQLKDKVDDLIGEL